VYDNGGGQPDIRATALSLFTLPNPRARYSAQLDRTDLANFEWGDTSTNILQVTEFNIPRDQWFNISLYSMPPNAGGTSIRRQGRHGGDIPSDFRMTRLYHEIQEEEVKLKGLCTASGRSLVYHYQGMRTDDWMDAKTWIADYLPPL
jgi:hypothetical protein